MGVELHNYVREQAIAVVTDCLFPYHACESFSQVPANCE